MDPQLHARIDALLTQHRVVLFMKGTPQQPRCGFSAKAAGILDELLGSYHAVDVLADPELREGIKQYGNWPTIPQLYVDRELIGGSDIIGQMYGSGELHRLFGLPEPDRTPPSIEITPAAAAAIRAGMADADGMALHLRIDPRWQTQFELAPAAGHEVRAVAAGIELLMDPATARRAEGMRIDWVESVQGAGLSVHLPGAPPAVRAMSVEQLRDRLAAGDGLLLIDVRPAADRARAGLPQARVLDGDSLAELEALPKDRPLAFLCHYGNSSRQAAEHFRRLGFREVYNVEGGIDAWSQRIDPAVPRY